MPRNSVPFCELLPFALQQRYKSGANIAQPNNAEVVGVDGGVSGDESLCSIVSGTVAAKKKGAIPPRGLAPCSIVTADSLLAAEGEVYTGKILKVVLIAGVAGSVYAEAGVEVVHFYGAKLDVRRDGVVKTTAKFHSKCVVVAAGAGKAMNVVIGIRVGVAMCSAEQGLAEGLEFARVLLDLRAEHVGKHVALHVVRQRNSVVDELVLQSAALGVTHEICLDSDPGGDVVNETAAAAEDVEAGDGA